MAWLHDKYDIPEEGDIVKEIKFENNIDIAKIIFQSGKHLTIQYYNEDRSKVK